MATGINVAQGHRPAHEIVIEKRAAEIEQEIKRMVVSARHSIGQLTRPVRDGRAAEKVSVK